MVLSMEEPWPGKGDLPWEYSRATGLAAALGLPHRLDMSYSVQPEGLAARTCWAATERLPRPQPKAQH